MLDRDGPMADRTELNAYWLPEIDGLDLEIRERRFGPGKVPLRVPQLTPAALKEVLTALRRNRAAHLAGRPLGELLDAIDAAARRLTRPGEASSCRS